MIWLQVAQWVKNKNAVVFVFGGYMGRIFIPLVFGLASSRHNGSPLPGTARSSAAETTRHYSAFFHLIRLWVPGWIPRRLIRDAAGAIAAAILELEKIIKCRVPQISCWFHVVQAVRRWLTSDEASLPIRSEAKTILSQLEHIHYADSIEEASVAINLLRTKITYEPFWIFMEHAHRLPGQTQCCYIAPLVEPGSAMTASPLELMNSLLKDSLKGQRNLAPPQYLASFLWTRRSLWEKRDAVTGERVVFVRMMSKHKTEVRKSGSLPLK